LEVSLAINFEFLLANAAMTNNQEIWVLLPANMPTHFGSEIFPVDHHIFLFKIHYFENKKISLLQRVHGFN